MKIHVHINTRIWMSITTIFVTAKRYKQPESTDEWITKYGVCIQWNSIKYFAIKRNEALYTHYNKDDPLKHYTK